MIKESGAALALVASYVATFANEGTLPVARVVTAGYC